MIRTGAQYREGLRDGREVGIDGERVKDICAHPAVIPIVDIRAAAFASDASCQWLETFYGHEAWETEDRRKLLALARDLLNSDYAGHRLPFVQFAEAPHFKHLAAVYGAFDFFGLLDSVRDAAGLSDKVKRSP